MKLLLDENLPHELRHQLPGHEVFTTAYMRWAGLKNGKLLNETNNAVFRAFITMDDGIEQQQNVALLRLTVFVLHAKSNRMIDLQPLMPELADKLEHAVPGTVVHVGRKT